jgi:flagellar basal-body rod protein FlgF
VSSAGFAIATAGAVAQSNALDVTANNIANASTAGFHGDRVTFSEVLGKAKSADTAMVSAGTARVDTQAGALTQTGNPLDCALEGDGYFTVKTPTGDRYTRAGNFQIDSSGDLAMADGSKVLGEGGATIAIPKGASVTAVAEDGTISADGQTLGKLAIARFASTSSLHREGGALFSSKAPPVPFDAKDPAPRVRSGMIESSNVNIVHSVVDLVKVSRTYESLMKMIQGYNDIESRAARDIGAPK